MTRTSTVTYMEGIALVEKQARTARLVVSGGINEDLEMALIDVSHELRRRVTKAEFSELVISVGLAHIDEVKNKIRKDSPE
jgi:hypothetical protein